MDKPINKESTIAVMSGEEIKGGSAIYLAEDRTAFNCTERYEYFSLKQLFSIVDGRLSASISDIRSILGVYCGRIVFTHEIPTLIDEVKSAKPDWYMQAKGLVDYIKWMNYTDNFGKLMDILDKDFTNVYIMVEEKP